MCQRCAYQEIHLLVQTLNLFSFYVFDIFVISPTSFSALRKNKKSSQNGSYNTLNNKLSARQCQKRSKSVCIFKQIKKRHGCDLTETHIWQRKRCKCVVVCNKGLCYALTNFVKYTWKEQGIFDTTRKRWRLQKFAVVQKLQTTCILELQYKSRKSCKLSNSSQHHIVMKQK